MRNFINDLDIAPKFDHVVLHIDNNAVLKLSRNPELHKRTKHIDVRYNFLRERVIEVKDLVTMRVDTKENVADAFTKALGRTTFDRLMELMGLG